MSSYLSFIYEFTIFFPHIFLYHNCNKKSCKIVCGLRFFLLNLIKVMVFFFFFFLSFIYGSLVVHYSLGFTAYKAASGGVFLRCETPKTLRKGMPRTPRTLPSMLRMLRSMLRTEEDVAKHA